MGCLAIPYASGVWIFEDFVVIDDMNHMTRWTGKVTAFGDVYVVLAVRVHRDLSVDRILSSDGKIGWVYERWLMPVKE